LVIDGTIHLQWQLGEEQTLALPVKLVSGADLAGFEFTVTFDPGTLTFTGLDRSATAEVQPVYVAAHQRGSSGQVRVGGVADFGLEHCLSSGTLDLGRLVFQPIDANVLQGSSLEAVNCILLTQDGNALGAIGERITVSTPDVEQAGVPDRLRLSLPNPLRAGSVISLALPEAGEIAASIYNVSGQKIRTLVEANLPAGDHEIVWNGRTDAGQHVTRGIYYLRVRTTQEEISRKITFVD
jgi:hypothetical protein